MLQMFHFVSLKILTFRYESVFSNSPLIKEIRTERERAKLFDGKVLLVLERNSLVAPEEAAAMRELV